MISIVSTSGTEYVIIDEYRYGKIDRATIIDETVRFETWKCLSESCPGLIEIDVDHKLMHYESQLISEHNHELTSDEFEIQEGTIKLYLKRRVTTMSLQPQTSKLEITLYSHATVKDVCKNIEKESSSLEDSLHDSNCDSDDYDEDVDDNDKNVTENSSQSLLNQSCFKYVKTSKNNHLLIYNGYRYRNCLGMLSTEFSTPEPNGTNFDPNNGNWRCSKKGCKGRLRIRNGTVIPTYNPAPHSHLPDQFGPCKSSTASSGVLPGTIPLTKSLSPLVLDVKFVQTSKGYIHLLYDGYRFRKSIVLRHSDNKSAALQNGSNTNGIWRCTRRDCNARLNLQNGTVIPRVNTAPHSHPSSHSTDDHNLKTSKRHYRSLQSARVLPVIAFTNESVNEKQYILVDGYRYRFGYTYWRCTEKYCSGSMKVNFFGDRRHILSEHFHRPDFRQDLIGEQILLDDVDTDFPPPPPLSETKFVQSVKGNYHLLYDGYRYRRYKSLPGIDSSTPESLDNKSFNSHDGCWRCTRKNCRARVKVNSGTVVPAFNPSLHNHPPDQLQCNKTTSGSPPARVQPVMTFTDEAIRLVEPVDGIPHIVVDEYRYRFGRQLAEGYSFWRCPESYCKGSMKINISGDQRQVLSEHFHPPNIGQGELLLPSPSLLEAKFVESDKYGKTVLFYAGYQYRQTKRHNSTNNSDNISSNNGNWRCVKSKCRGRVKVYNGTVVPTLNPAAHSHLPEHLDYDICSSGLSLVQSTVTFTFTDKAIKLDQSVAGKSNIVVDGYRYCFGRQLANGYTYWVCLDKECTASLNVNISGDQREILSEHSHSPIPESDVMEINNSNGNCNTLNDGHDELPALLPSPPLQSVSEFRFIKSSQGNIHLIFDGYRYRVYQQSIADSSPTLQNENNINNGHWRCVRNRCRARVKVHNGTVAPLINSEPHSHPPEHFDDEKGPIIPAWSRFQPVLTFTDEAIDLVDSIKGKTNIVVDRYRYRFGRKLVSDFTYWRCTEKGCKGSMKINTTGDLRVVLAEHFHPPNDELTTKKFTNELKRKSSTTTSVNETGCKFSQGSSSKVEPHYTVPSIPQKRSKKKLPDVGGGYLVPPNQTIGSQVQQQPNFGYYNQPCTATTIDFANANFIEY